MSLATLGRDQEDMRDTQMCFSDVHSRDEDCHCHHVCFMAQQIIELDQAIAEKTNEIYDMENLIADIAEDVQNLEENIRSDKSVGDDAWLYLYLYLYLYMYTYIHT